MLYKDTEELCECGARFSRFIEPRLLLLLFKGESYGYELVSKLNEISFPGEPLDAGNVYRNLRRMENEGLIKSRWATAKSGPPRRIYRITIEGEDRLRAWMLVIEERRNSLTRLIEDYKTFVEKKK
ncbi:PadR family transcriptional regulator [bacterium]|nr:MAG: PadR family transcriptional regulator [bacterium]